MAKKRLFIHRRMLDSQEWRIRMLADAGFHGKFIAKRVSRPGRHVTTSMVYRVCKDAGIRLRDYRDGVGIAATVAISRQEHKAREA